MARTLSKGRKKLVFVPKSLAPTIEEALKLTSLTGTGAFDASEYALVDGFQLGFGDPQSVDATPIGSPRTVNLVGEGEVNASINFTRDTDEAQDKAWEFHATVDVEFWGILRDGPKMAREAWAVDDEVDVFDLIVTNPNMRQDAEVWSFNVTYGQGPLHTPRQKITAGA